MPFRTLDLPTAEILFDPQFFTSAQSAAFTQRLHDEIAWHAPTIETDSGSYTLPRRIAWYGDEGRSYAYSGVSVDPLAWIPLLQQIRHLVEEAAGVRFNSVLLNLYRDENDSVGWHSDDEPELGDQPVIASVSFGSEREFQLKRKDDPQQRHSLTLPSGSLLIMRGDTQTHWKHRLPKANQPCAPRINLTFRIIR